MELRDLSQTPEGYYINTSNSEKFCKEYNECVEYLSWTLFLSV
jgi:hypothetical protein